VRQQADLCMTHWNARKVRLTSWNSLCPSWGRRVKSCAQVKDFDASHVQLLLVMWQLQEGERQPAGGSADAPLSGTRWWLKGWGIQSMEGPCTVP
jgi:hypothetical protein